MTAEQSAQGNVSERRKAEEDENQVGGRPSGSAFEARDRGRRESVENGGTMKHKWPQKRGEQTHCNLCVLFCF